MNATPLFAALVGTTFLAAHASSNPSTSSASVQPHLSLSPAQPFVGGSQTGQPGAQGAPSEVVVDYDIVYVRQPRFGNETNTIWPEVFHPARLERGADLMLLHPDGSEEVLVPAGAGSVTDPYVSLDGEWVYYSLFHDLSPERLNYGRNRLPYAGADIFRIHVGSRTIEQLTHGEFTPNTGAGLWDESDPLNTPEGGNKLGYGILNLGACPLPGGKLAFTSNRNGFVPPEEFTYPTMQLFVMDEDGRNVEFIAPMNVGSALHPFLLQDGQIAFSSFETQGLRDRRMWGIWAINPDGQNWKPLASAFRRGQAFHFATQVSDGDIVFADYYNLNNNGFGALYRMPVVQPDGGPSFYGPSTSDSPGIAQTSPSGNRFPIYFPFTPRGLVSITPFTHGIDWAAPLGEDNRRVGKFTQPCAAPDDHLMVVWTSGPANDLERPTSRPLYDSGIYIMPQGEVMENPAGLVRIKNNSQWNEAWPRPVVPYSRIHGMEEPPELPWLPNDGTVHPRLPRGTPYGLIGASSFYHRESEPAIVKSWLDFFDGRDAFNVADLDQSSNWLWQGADAGKYDNSEIWAVRILAMEGNTHRSYGAHKGSHFFNHANEKLRILGEIPLRKLDEAGETVIDARGEPDTSFLARIPADVPFTFQTIDREGMTLNMAQTWHQVRPGEKRVDCGGCHAHSKEPLPFEGTYASQEDAPIWDLVHGTTLVSPGTESGLQFVPRPIVDVEFVRNIRPILRAKCVPCHTTSDPNPPANLVFDDTEMYDGLPGDYKKLADDREARWGYRPVIANGQWRQTNASRYIRKFQSRRSLLIWKLYGRRFDGWSNDDHPTESVPGDPTTLPPGTEEGEADLDLTGLIMPPPGSGIPPLTDREKRLFVRWIDLGCPIDLSVRTEDAGWGFTLDDHRPTLTMQTPAAGEVENLSEILLGAADAYSGVDWDSLSVQANFRVQGRSPWTELADLAEIEHGEGILRIETGPVYPMNRGRVKATIRDRQGNITRIDRTFRITQ